MNISCQDEQNYGYVIEKNPFRIKLLIDGKVFMTINEHDTLSYEVTPFTR